MRKIQYRLTGAVQLTIRQDRTPQGRSPQDRLPLNRSPRWRLVSRLSLALLISLGLLVSTLGTNLDDVSLYAQTQSCGDNLIRSGSFELDKDGWAEEGVSTGRGSRYAVDGTRYLYLKPIDVGTIGTFYQDVPNIGAGAELELIFAAGSHKPELYIHEGYIEFYNANSILLGTSTKVDIDFDVENAPPILKYYTIMASAPVGTSFVRVTFALDGDYLKLDDVRLKSCEPLGSIGDTVWSDPDDDGDDQINGDDFGIQGVKVRLLDDNGDLITTETTNENGEYLFTGLSFDTYTIEIDTTTLPDIKQGNPAYDPDGVEDNKSEVTLTVNSPNNRGQDFAYFQTLGSIGDTVWSDPDGDGDGIINGDDFPIKGVVVKLLDSNRAVIKTTKTDDNGKYYFTQLPLNETYIVQVDTTTLPDVKQGNPAYDPEGDNNNESQVTLTLAIPNVREQDFAYFQTLGSIGDTIWSDPNGDGNNTMDGDDFPIAGVVVNLLDSNGGFMTTDTTGDDGKYLFEELPLNETYIIQIDTTTLPDVKQDNPAYDPDGGDDNKSEVRLTVANPNNQDQDFAYFQTLGSIGDTVWSDPDNDGDGVINGDDFPIKGVIINLFNGDGDVVATEVTDDDGKYLFENLALNEAYTLEIDTTTLPDIKQGNPAYDPDGNDDNRSTVTLTVASPNNLDQDFAYYEPTPATPVPTEPPVNTPLPSTPTRVPSTPVPTEPPADTPTRAPSTPVLTETPAATPTRAPSTPTAPPAPNSATLGDKVWKDHNGNGIQDADEPGVPNVPVALWVDTDNSGEPDEQVDSTTTDDDGLYSFTNVDPTRIYIIQFGLMPSMPYTTPNQGNDDAQDSDADPKTGTTGQIAVGIGETDESIDAGMKDLPAALGDTVWLDENENGLQDADEKGVPFVTVNLWTDDDGNGTPDTQVSTMQTTPLGQYLFNNLDPDQPYIIQVLPPADHTITLVNQGDDDAQDSDVDPETGISAPYTMDPGETNPTADAGLVPTGPTASIGNLIWLDENANGIQDEGEVGVAGIKVILLTAGGEEVATTMTDADGFYNFSGLTPGLYMVKVELPSDAYLFTQQDQVDDQLDSDVEPSTGQTIVTELVVNENDLTWDIGLIAPPQLLIEKTPSSEVIQQGEVILFDIAYRNTGFGDATGVVITELVPQRTTYLAERSTPGWVCEGGNTSAGTICTFTVGELPAQTGNQAALTFAVKVDTVVENAVTLLLNQIQIRDDGLHPSGISGQSVDEARVAVRHPTPLGTVNEGEVTTSQSYIYLPFVRRNLFKEQPTTLLTNDEWIAVWACAVGVHPEYASEQSVIVWAAAVCGGIEQ